MKGVFFSYGALGLLWLVLWLPLVSGRSPQAIATEALQLQKLLSQPPSQGLTERSEERSGELSEKISLERRRREGGEAPLSTTEPLAVAGAAIGSMRDRNTGGSGEFSGESSAGAAEASGEFSAGTGEASGKRSVGGGAVGERGDRPESSPSQFEIGDGPILSPPQPERGDGMVSSPPQSRQSGGIMKGFGDVPWKAYATNGQIWSIASAHMSHNWGLYVMLAWLPTYFNQARYLPVVVAVCHCCCC